VAIARNLAELNKLSGDELLEGRYNKFRAMSRFIE
jgi:acetyl-CoA carboxylase alpha subunit